MTRASSIGHVLDGAPRGERACSPRGLRARRAVITALLVACAVAISTPSATADGDPASDYLLVQNVYLGFEPSSPAASGALKLAANGVYSDGSRVKVALIYGADDLGSIPSLFGNPTGYARFLGIELGLWYVGPLLVVMPAGFGIYDGGRSTAQEEQVLQSIPIEAATPDDLARTATAALNALVAAGALRSPDITPPLVTAYPADARRGRPAVLHFAVFDDSGRSKALIRVYEQGSLLATITSAAAFAIGTRDVKVHWLVPARLRSRQLRFCVVATDPAGNTSKPSCAPFLRVT